MRKLSSHIKAHLAAGLLLTIPLAATYAVLIFVWDAIQALLGPLVGRIPAPLTGLSMDVAAIFVLATLIYLVGVLGRTLVGRRIVRMWEAVLNQIPIVRPIYRIARQSTRVFAGSADLQSSKVVMLEYPRSGILSLGFVTSHYIDENDQMLLTIYIPTIPNPTSGFLAIVKQEQVVETNLTFEDAMKIVISAGVLTNEVMSNRRCPPEQPTST